jgi:hypothetical protein
VERTLKAWERCEQSPFNGAHLWELFGSLAFCHYCDAAPPPEHRSRIETVLRTAREGAGVPADWWRE